MTPPPTVIPLEIYRIIYSEEQIRECCDSIRKNLEENSSGRYVRYVNLGGIDVRIIICDESFFPAICYYLGYSLKDKSSSFDYTIILWKTVGIKTESKKVYNILCRDFNKAEPVLTFYEGGVTWFDKASKTFFCGRPDSTLERLTLSGDIFVKQFYKILKEGSSALVHGACVGIDGKGVLLCARGGKGKSTLAISALVRGFEFVADDYLILDTNEGELVASPIYSIVKLTHNMHDRMRDELKDANIISQNPQENKYIMNISCWHNQFRKNYPIKLCLMPEIAQGLAEPSITMCSDKEKGEAIIHMVHSTILQQMDIYDNYGSLKLIQMLQTQDFFRIRLCQDIFKNVECLRAFLKEHKT